MQGRAPGVRYGELDEIASYRENSGGEVHDVAAKAPNAWGLYDVIGNVWEWCWYICDPQESPELSHG
jgi:formylglycine-generating enzyme